METIRKENKMGTMPEGRLLINMSWPIILSMLVQALYNVVDSMFVARIPEIGEAALSALGYAYPMQMLIIGFGVGTAVGVNSLVSRRLGAKRFETANMAAGNGLVLTAITALVFAVIGLTLSGVLFRLFTEDALIQELGTSYLRIVCVFSLGVFMQLCLERIMVAQGKTVIAMAMQLMGAVLNIVLDRVLVLGWRFIPAMGVEGAAIATVAAQLIAMCVSFVILFAGKHEVRVTRKTLRLDRHIVADIYRVGMPSILLQTVSVAMMFFMNGILGGYDTVAVGVFGVYYKLQSIVLMPVFGMTNAAMSIIAYNYGARNPRRMMRVLRIGVISAAIFMTLGMTLFQIFPQTLMGLFEAQGTMLSHGVTALRTASLSFPMAAVSICFSVFFGAIGMGMMSMWISFARQLLVLVPVSYAISRLFGDVAIIWWAFPIAEVCACTLAITAFVSVYKKRVKPLYLPAEAELN